MLMTMRYQSGQRVEAVVLAANEERMRVVIDSQRDTTALHRVATCWYTDDGSEVEIEAMIPLDGVEVLSLAQALTTAAGRGNC
jgi:hypothetical protein